MSLAAFYAPRGMAPAQVLQASPSELAFLQAAREAYEREMHWILRRAILCALSPDAAKEAEKIYGG